MKPVPHGIPTGWVDGSRTEPLTASENRTTDHVYNARNDVTQRIVGLNGSTPRMITRYCCGPLCATGDVNNLFVIRRIDNYTNGAKGDGKGEVEDVTTDFTRGW